ncbi:hypothetical protein AURDEDRAFT_111429 [Auricularia subglabra TFB-10046 SS5]|nr:hypothetical protein AURDEDRAFT_111429 [Auricularia subglabra TFB-10046 SS5]
MTIGTDVSRSPRDRMPTPHARTFPPGVRDAPLKDLPPLPVPPPCPPPAIPLPPTPLEMQRALAEERLRTLRLAEELQRVTEERDALARRLQGKKAHGGAVFDYDHAIAHMVRSPGAESTFSSADEVELEADDLFYKGSRSATPDADEPFPPTPQNTSPPRFGSVQTVPRPGKSAFSQSFVELPSSGEPVDRPASKLAPLKSARRFVRHGSSRSISSLPAPPPPTAATRSGLSRPSTAGAGSTPPVRPRRVGIIQPK